MFFFTFFNRLNRKFKDQQIYINIYISVLWLDCILWSFFPYPLCHLNIVYVYFHVYFREFILNTRYIIKLCTIDSFFHYLFIFSIYFSFIDCDMSSIGHIVVNMYYIQDRFMVFIVVTVFMAMMLRELECKFNFKQSDIQNILHSRNFWITICSLLE